MASKAAVARKRKRNAEQAQLAGESREEEVLELLKYLMGLEKELVWFFKTEKFGILDQKQIDVLIGLVVGGKRLVCPVDVYRGWGARSLLKKQETQKRAERKYGDDPRLHFSPVLSGPIKERARVFFERVKKSSVSPEKLQRIWKEFFGSDLEKIERTGGVWNHFCLSADSADERMKALIREEVEGLSKETLLHEETGQLSNNLPRPAAPFRKKKRRRTRLKKNNSQGLECKRVFNQFLGLLKTRRGLTEGQTCFLRENCEGPIRDGIRAYFSGLGKAVSEVSDDDFEKHWFALCIKLDTDLTGWRMTNAPGRVPLLAAMPEPMPEVQVEEVRIEFRPSKIARLRAFLDVLIAKARMVF